MRVTGTITAALQASDDPMQAPNWLPWRRVDRTIYAMVGQQPSDADRSIGVMETAELADEAVLSHNTTLKRVQR